MAFPRSGEHINQQESARPTAEVAMDRDTLEREWSHAVLEASACAQRYAALERDPGADPDLVSRAAVALWRAEAAKREVLRKLDQLDSGSAGDSTLAA
jgi:hypothetical protein